MHRGNLNDNTHGPYQPINTESKALKVVYGESINNLNLISCDVMWYNTDDSPPGFTSLIETSVASCSKSLGTMVISLSPFNRKGLSVDTPHTRNFTGDGLLSFFTNMLHV